MAESEGSAAGSTPADFSAALEKARQLAAKLSGAGGEEVGEKRRHDGDSTDEPPAKRQAMEQPPAPHPPAPQFAPPSMGAGGQTVMVPEDAVGLIIGKGGETIRDLQQRSGANIQVQRDAERTPGVHERMVTVTGNPMQVQQAVALINEISSEAHRRDAQRGGDGGGFGGGGFGGGGGGGGFHVGGMGGETVKVPNGAVGLVIGRGGATIKEIQMRSGAKVQIVPQHEMPAGATMRDIHISGPPDAVHIAKELIMEKTQEDGRRGGGGGGGMPGGARLEMHIPNNVVGLIIGKGGMTIKELQQMSGARIQVTNQDENPADSKDRLVVLHGSPEATQHAQHLIQERLGNLRENGGRGGFNQSYGGGPGGGGGGGGGGGWGDQQQGYGGYGQGGAIHPGYSVPGYAWYPPPYPPQQYYPPQQNYGPPQGQYGYPPAGGPGSYDYSQQQYYQQGGAPPAASYDAGQQYAQDPNAYYYQQQAQQGEYPQGQQGGGGDYLQAPPAGAEYQQGPPVVEQQGDYQQPPAEQHAPPALQEQGGAAPGADAGSAEPPAGTAPPDAS